MVAALALCTLQLLGASTQGPAVKQHADTSHSQRELQAPGFQEGGFCGLTGLANELVLMKGAAQEAQCVNKCIDDPQCVSYEIAAIEHSRIRCRTFDKLITRSNAAAPDYTFQAACLVKETALEHSTAGLHAGLKTSKELKFADIKSVSSGGTSFSALANTVKTMHIDVQAVPVIAVEGFDSLVEVQTDLVISSVDCLEKVTFPMLKKVGGSVIIKGNGADGGFLKLSMPELMYIGGDLIISGNGPNLCDIDLGKLLSVDGQIKINDVASQLPPLSTECKLSLPSLATVGFNPLDSASSFDISSLIQFNKVNVDSLTSVQSGLLYICDLPNVVELSFSNLTNAHGITISSVPMLNTETSINFESLTTVHKALALEDWPQATFAAFNALVSVGILALGYNSLSAVSSFVGFESLMTIHHALVLVYMNSFKTTGLDMLKSLGSSTNEHFKTDGVFEVSSDVDFTGILSGQMMDIKGGFYIGDIDIIMELGVPKSTLFPKNHPALLVIDTVIPSA